MGFSKCLYIGPYFECTYREGEEPDLYELFDGKEPLYELHSGGNDGALYLAPNVRRIGAPRPDFDDDNDNEFHLDMSAVDTAAEMRWPQEAFAEELMNLREAYAKVEMKWGVHQCFM